jgi:hypothetical protein
MKNGKAIWYNEVLRAIYYHDRIVIHLKIS